MRQKRLKLSALLLLGLGLTGLQAQTMYVKESSSTQTAYSLNSVRKITFSGGNATVQKTDNTTGVYALNGLRYLSFAGLTVDTQPPTVPSSLTSTNTTTTTVSLSWNASTDNVGVTYYLIYKGGVMIDSVTTTSYMATALTPSSTYSFTVKARDAANNISEASNALSVTTNTHTSIDKLQLSTCNALSTYPNPVTNVLNIDLSGVAAGGTISILSLEGKLLQTQKTDGANMVTLNLNQLSRGIYLCRYSNATEIKTVKIIKQ